MQLTISASLNELSRSTLEADPIFASNLRSAIATTLSVHPRSVTITSVRVDSSSGIVQVQYEVRYLDTSAAAAASQTMNQATSGASAFA